MTAELNLLNLDVRKHDSNHRINSSVRGNRGAVKIEEVKTSDLEYGVVVTKEGLIYIGRYEPRNRNEI